MSTPVDGDAAAQTLLGWGTCQPGLCLKYVWDAYAAHGATSSRSYATAYDAWKGSAGQHPDDWDPPSGVPVYFGPRADSSAGDVVISLGGGLCAATDWPGWGTIGTTTLAARQNQIGRPYLGWTETILNYPIAQASGQRPAPSEEDTMMSHLLQIDAATDGRWFLVTFETGTAQRIWNGLQLDLIRRDPTVDQVFGDGQPLDVLSGLTITGE